VKTIVTSASTLILLLLTALAATLPVVDRVQAAPPSPYHADGLAVTEAIAAGQASAGRWIFVSGTRSTLNLKVTSLAGPRIDQVSIWENRNQRWIETVAAAAPATTLTRVALSGWYYVYVHRSDATRATDYRLDANVTDPQQVLEAGATFAAAFDLGVVGAGGTNFFGRVNVADPTDIIKVNLPFGRQRLDVYAFNTFQGGATVDLFDGAGSLINGRDTMGDESLLFGASLPGGTYYVKIAGGANMPGTGYHLYLHATDETTGAPPASGSNTGGRLGDNNGVQYLAERLSADAAGGFSIQQTIGLNDRDDWFRIDGAPTCCYLLRVQGLPVKSIFEPTMVEFWGPRGRYLPLTVAIDGSLVFIVRMEAATNWVHINVPSGAPEQTYQLSLSYRPEK
jgi:hypothetical protein